MTWASIGTGAGPLAGLRVVEMGSLAPAPFGCMLLADLGADIIEVQRRGAHSGITRPPGPLDRGKRRIVADLKDPGDLKLLRELVREADVFVEGFRPGVAERIGIGPDALCADNPRLVYARMTGWGQDGPLAATAGHDINYLALSGALDLIGRAGQRPHAPVNLLADFAGGGLFLALGVLAALLERDRSGRGQVIDAAMVDGASLLTSFIHGLRAQGAWPGTRGENLLDGGAYFYDTYECSDGRFVAIGCVEDAFRQTLLEGIDLGRLEDELPPQAAANAWDELRAKIAERIGTRTRDEWADVFAGSDACLTPVLSPWEAPTHPHHVARGSFVQVGDVVQPAPGPRFSRTPVPAPTPMDRGQQLEQIVKEWSGNR